MAENKDPKRYVVDEFKTYESFHQDRYDKAWKIYDDWTGKPPKREWDWQNAVHVPVTFEAEQTITPRIFAALFPNEAPVEVFTIGDTSEESGIKTKFLIQHYFRLANVQGEALPALTQNTLLGTSYIEAGWQIKRNSENKILYNRPSCNFISFFEIYPHPQKLSVTDPFPLIRRQIVGREYILSLMNKGFDRSAVLEALNSKSIVDNVSMIVGNDGKPLTISNKDCYEILSYWGNYSSDENTLGVPYWIMVVNRQVLLRSIPNPYKHQRAPICKLNMYKDSKPNWFGIGAGVIGKPTQDRLNKIVNQRLDNVDLVLNKQGVFNGNDPLINVRKLGMSKPGQWHKVSDVNGSIRWMDIPDVTQSSYQEEVVAKADYRESTGATQTLMPTDGPQHRTATGISMLQGAAGMRFRPILRMLEVDFIQDLAQMFLSNLQQFMSEPEDVMINLDDGSQRRVTVNPDDIQANTYFLPTGISELLNKDMQIQQLLQFKQLTMDDPTINRREINKRIAELMGFKNVKNLVVQQQPVVIQPGGLTPEEQGNIARRFQEGASPDEIKAEMLGLPPAPAPPTAQGQATPPASQEQPVEASAAPGSPNITEEF